MERGLGLTAYREQAIMTAKGVCHTAGGWTQPRKGAMLMSVYDFFAFIVLLIALVVAIKA